MEAINNILIVGSGNVAWHLARIFSSVEGLNVTITGRNLIAVQEISSEFNIEIVSFCSDITYNTDLIVLAIKDNAIRNFLTTLQKKDTLIVHVAGSVPISVFEDNFSKYGVFYPLQSFTKDEVTDFNNIPIFLEASGQNELALLSTLACKISENVFVVNSEERKLIHLGAVFCNNFVNFMLLQSEIILSKVNLDSEIYEPLLLETFRKAKKLTPNKAQTGPARRGDFMTIQDHLKMLGDNSQLQDIYRMMTNKIFEHFNPDKI